MAEHGVAPAGPQQHRASAPLRVLVVDAHELSRSGLCELLAERGFRVAGVPDGRAALARAGAFRPDVVLLELDLPGMPGLEVARRLAQEWPNGAVVAFTLGADTADVESAAAAGIRGYLLKEATVDDIVAGVRAAAAGQAPVSPAVAGLMLERLRSYARVAAHPARARELSGREREVLALIVAGRSNDEIAAALAISRPTAKNHASSILDKLGVENRIQAAVHAVRNGLA